MSPFLDKLQTSGVVAQPEHDSMRQALESRYAKQKEGWAFCPQADGTVAATATTCDADGSKLTKGQYGPMLRACKEVALVMDSDERRRVVDETGLIGVLQGGGPFNPRVRDFVEDFVFEFNKLDASDKDLTRKFLLKGLYPTKCLAQAGAKTLLLQNTRKGSDVAAKVKKTFMAAAIAPLIKARYVDSTASEEDQLKDYVEAARDLVYVGAVDLNLGRPTVIAYTEDQQKQALKEATSIATITAVTYGVSQKVQNHQYQQYGEYSLTWFGGQ